MSSTRAATSFSLRLLRAVPLLVALVLASTPPSLAAAEPEEATPVVVALDSSRSLSTAESGAAVALVRDLAARLPAGTPLALLTFDDEVRWLASAPGAGGETLDAVVPRGRYTLLHDALVEAVRTLGDGGALVVISDGRDENSATTLEDVARLARDAGVRVVAVAAGRADERALRRLALLTGGSYVGPLRGLEADRLVAEVEGLREQVANERRARAEKAAPPPAATPAPTPAPPPPPATGLGAGAWALGLLAVGLAGGFGFWLARRPSRAVEESEPTVDVGTSPGVPFPVPVASGSTAPPAPPPLDADFESRLLTRPAVGPGQLFEISFDETAAFESLPRLDAFERTLVLTEENVLTVREHGHEARRFRLPPQQGVSVGRDAQRNTLAFQDPTLSAQHFRVVMDEGMAYLVDIGSTNGVYLREERVRSARLRPGDRFRAGLLEFELQVRQQSMT